MRTTKPAGARRKQGAVMNKLFAAGVAAVLLGGVAMFVSTVGSTEARSTPIIVKGDRLDARTYGPSCSQASWPYYETGCLRNRVGASREARSVRLVSTDRAR